MNLALLSLSYTSRHKERQRERKTERQRERQRENVGRKKDTSHTHTPHTRFLSLFPLPAQVGKWFALDPKMRAFKQLDKHENRADSSICYGISITRFRSFGVGVISGDIAKFREAHSHEGLCLVLPACFALRAFFPFSLPPNQPLLFPPFTNARKEKQTAKVSKAKQSRRRQG